ncbi:hypothetical protein HAX54_024684 [Datura stramonium]|uniref:Uncharacterized protein n=1 Tax=Datura stramonium TaxID=4076 RepID=A0ABS8RH98_DATST|nr:hypothetical protein [Datura stramonium]
MTEYETRFYTFSCHALMILADQIERIRQFVRGLIYPIRMKVYHMEASRASFQKVVDPAKDYELMRREEFGSPRDKRYRTSGTHNGTLSGGRGSSRRDFRPQSSRTIHASI